MSYLEMIQANCTLAELSKALEVSIHALREKPWDMETYRAEANAVIEVGEYLLKQFNKLKRKFWLLGEKRKVNKEKVEQMRALLHALNFHVKVLEDYRYCNEWKKL